MDTRRIPTGFNPGTLAGSAAEIGPLLAHLEQRLAELDRLHREIAENAQALAHAAVANPGDRGRAGAGARSVYSIRDAAAELGVSVSMLHKLLKQRRLGHLKVGARTLITADHLEQFREESEVAAPAVAAQTSPETPPTVFPQGSSVHRRSHPRAAPGALAISAESS